MSAKAKPQANRMTSWFAALLAIAVVMGSARPADAFPDRMVKIVCVYPAGGGLDIVMRAVAQKLSQKWGQPVIIENVTGAGTTLGTAMVANATADGHTILATDVSFSISASLYAKLAYSPERDLAPVSMFAEVSQGLLVHPSLPVNTVQELVAFATKNPDKVSYATAGTGTPPHLTMVRFNKRAGLEIQAVPYRGAAASLRDVVAGLVPVYSGAYGTAVPFVKSGQLRPLAVLDKQRSSLTPDVPTIGESGYPGLEVNAWYGLMVPTNTPRPIVDQINIDLNSTLDTVEVQNALTSLGNISIKGFGPDAFRAFLATDFVKWAEALKDSNAKPQ